MCRAGVEPYLVAGLRAGQGWGQGQSECCCHQAAPQQAPQSPPEEQLPLQLHSQVQTPLWCSLSLQHMIDLVKQEMLAKRKHFLTLKVASHVVWPSLLPCAQALHICWAARYNTWLLSKLMPNSAVFSFIFLFSFHYMYGASFRREKKEKTTP